MYIIQYRSQGRRCLESELPFRLYQKRKSCKGTPLQGGAQKTGHLKNVFNVFFLQSSIETSNFSFFD
jgi:hypothetical protein